MGPPGPAASSGRGCCQRGGCRPAAGRILGSGSLSRGRSHPGGCNSLLPPAAGSPSPSLLPVERHWLGLCPPRARPVSCVCGLSAAASQAALCLGPREGKTSSSRSARAPRPGLRPPCPAASFLVCGIQGPRGQHLREALPSSGRLSSWTGSEGGSFPFAGWPQLAKLPRLRQGLRSVRGTLAQDPRLGPSVLSPWARQQRAILASPGVPRLRSPSALR